ncbi:hemin uptake protein HemP [Thioalkalivibrio sp.]|uniref:hemin uptake protein HemP n=1 Tax=Thioalkalivibrio sp. TaxID=2093813 RepID=UPI003568DD93
MQISTEKRAHPGEQARPAPAGGNVGTAVIDSQVLFGNAQVLQIDHQGHTYTLRKTRNGKLILTK